MRFPLLILGTLLTAAAAATAPGRVSLPSEGRALVRPLVVPWLWKGLEAAQRDGTPEEYAARGRVLMNLIPDWTDGQIHIATRLAFEASLTQRTPEAALSRLLAGLDYLEEILATTTRPEAREAIRKSQARLLYMRCGSDPKLAAGFLQRRGSSPTVWVERYLRSIPRLAQSSHLRSELCVTLIEGIAIDIRLSEPTETLLRSLDAATELLTSDRDPGWAAQRRTALEKLRSYLQHPDESNYRALFEEPFLDTVCDALEARRKTG